jgi:hypothetical protein
MASAAMRIPSKMERGVQSVGALPKALVLVRSRQGSRRLRSGITDSQVAPALAGAFGQLADADTPVGAIGDHV